MKLKSVIAAVAMMFTGGFLFAAGNGPEAAGDNSGTGAAADTVSKGNKDAGNEADLGSVRFYNAGLKKFHSHKGYFSSGAGPDVRDTSADSAGELTADASDAQTGQGENAGTDWGQYPQGRGEQPPETANTGAGDKPSTDGIQQGPGGTAAQGKDGDTNKKGTDLDKHRAADKFKGKGDRFEGRGERRDVRGERREERGEWLREHERRLHREEVRKGSGEQAPKPAIPGAGNRPAIGEIPHRGNLPAPRTGLPGQAGKANKKGEEWYAANHKAADKFKGQAGSFEKRGEVREERLRDRRLQERREERKEYDKKK